MKSLLRVVAIGFASLCLLTSAGCFFTATTPTDECTADSDCNTGFICENTRCVTEGGTPACDGDLRIAWEFNDAPACPEDADDMVIKVFSPTGAAIHTSANGDAVACTAGERTYRNLPCGTYQVQVGAVDAVDEFTWSAPQGPIDVVDDNTASITANLAPE